MNQSGPMRTPWLGLPLLVVLSCAAPRPSLVSAAAEDAAPRAALAPTAAVPAVLVWSEPREPAKEEVGDVETGARAKDQARTSWLDPSGNVTSEQSGVTIAIDGGLWAFDVTRNKRASHGCPEADLHLSPSWLDAASLVSASPKATRPLRPSKDGGADDDGETPVVEKTITLAGSVGPYLFVRDYEWVFGCGAHGSWSTVPRVYDARTGSEAALDLGTDARSGSAAAQADKQIIAAITSLALATPWNAGPVQYVATEPRVSDHGIALAHVFLGGVPYAFSASSWSSYAVDTEVPAAVPEELAPYMKVPPAVAAFIASHPDRVVGGWTALSP